ncbi:MAG: anaerobic glycerol-3-phosphate dehydrogenase subunit B [Syntrophaceae bacterium]|nr:anaerobic glycerol-3-phosphate dehydrogenase subunit B [Syntrophaceae bacterium]
MHFDLIVIGMGLSGLMAAKTASESGSKVLILGKGMGALCLFSNTIDLLETLPKGMKLDEGLSQWIKDHPQHPYSKVGAKIVEEALTSFTSLFPLPYSFVSAGDGNSLLPTGAGTLRPTYLIPTTMVAGASVREQGGLIVGFKGFKDFYPDYAATLLGCRSLTLPPFRTFHEEITAAGLARSMEKESFREEIGREIRREMGNETRVGFPAVLGVRDPWGVKKGLEETIGAEVFEIPILPPSIPGMRIFNRFKEWLVQRGVTVLLGHSVSKAILRGRRCEGIRVSNPPLSSFYSADRYILSTGRFVGGGLVANEEKIYEPIFDLPVSQPRSREEWFRKSFFSNLSHPVHQAGILTDSSLRPVDDKGERVLENVWIAGSILAGHDSTNEKSREGVEIATGYMAAKCAMKK